MKDRWRERFPSSLSWPARAGLQLRKVCRQTLTRWQEWAATGRPLDPLLEDGEATEPPGEQVFAANPPEAITKCARWLEDDLQRPDIRAIADQLRALKAELTAKGLRFTNTAGNFLAREYHRDIEEGKLWEDAWLIRHAGVLPEHRVLDVGGASTIFSFYLASLGCCVAVVDNDWANCGTLLNARRVAGRMGWRLDALDRDVSRPLPFADETFDRVFAVCVLEHLPPRVRQGLMRELGRVLRPGGIAAFTMDYDHSRPVLLTDKGLRFAYRGKLERDVIRPSGLRLSGPADWTDAYPRDTFMGALFLEKPPGRSAPVKPVRHGLRFGMAAVWFALAAMPARADAGVACAVPRSRQVLSGFAPSRMAALFRQGRRSPFGSSQSRFRTARFGSPRFGSIRFGSTRFGTSRSSGLAGGRMSQAFSASHTRFSSRTFFSSAPRCPAVVGR